LNEADNLPELVARLTDVFDAPRLRQRGGGELILVDDGSTDATWPTMNAAKASHSFVVPLRHESNAGLAAAWRTGILRARGRLVCVLDADLQYRPEDILALHEALERTGADIAQGWRSRWVGKRGARFYISRGLHHLLNGLFEMKLEDNKSGFLLCRREVFADLLDYRRNYTYWQLFVTVAAKAKGYTLCEVETVFDRRRRGRSFLSDVPVLTIARASIDVARALGEYGPRRGIARW
jgi:phenylacetate-CoA ligase